MANVYVNSGAGGADDGTSWTDAFLTLAQADGAGSSANDVVLVHKGHTESHTGATYNFSNSRERTPIKILCVDKDASDALSVMTGFITTTSGNISILHWGIYMYGLRFDCTVTNAHVGTIGQQIGNNSSTCIFEKCTWKFPSATNTTTDLTFSVGDGNGGSILFDDCIFDFDDVTGTWNAPMLVADSKGRTTFRRCEFSFAGSPTWSDVLFKVNHLNGGHTVINVEDCDLSEFGFTTALIDWDDAGSMNAQLNFKRCKFNASLSAFLRGTKDYTNQLVTAENCEIGTISAPAAGAFWQESEWGTLKHDTARYRTGGANDSETSYSWQVVTNANCVQVFKFWRLPRMTVWTDDDSGGAITLKVYVASGVTLNDDDIWIEVHSPDETASPSQTSLGKFQTTRMAPQGTPAALTTDAVSTWNGTGVGTKQEMSVTINPTEPGPVSVEVCVAIPSETVYVDPYLELT